MQRLLLFIVVSFIFSTCSSIEKKEIKASYIINLLKKGKHVHFYNKIIIDDLDFSKSSEPFLVSAHSLQTEIKSNIFFSNCIFLGKVTSNGKWRGNANVKSCFRNNLIFFDCDFRGEVNFSETVVYGLLNFSKSTFRENSDFSGMNVLSKDAYFSEIKVEKRFSMIYSLFADNLYVISSTFADNVSFQETTVNGKFILNNSVFQKRPGFDLMKINGKAYFNYTKFEDGVNFSGTRFMVKPDIIETGFNDDIFINSIIINK